MLRHVGDIAASRALQVGIRAFPDLRSPIAWSFLAAELCLEKCFESFRNYISESLGILFTPSLLIALVRHPGVEFWLFSSQISLKKILGSRGYLGIVPIDLWREHCSWCLLSFRGCGSVLGSWAPRCCRHNFIVEILEYLSFADIENLFYAVVGEVTSTPPSTGAGVSGVLP